MGQTINLVKLCVGCDSVEQLAAWQEMRGAGAPDWRPRHVTRMWPKREAEMVAGGSLYWVIKGVILARQPVIRLDEVIGEVDVCYLLRMQLERQHDAVVPTLREFHTEYGLTVERAARMRADALIMHPGPMNRGVEIAGEVADRPNAVITEQVTNGVAVRMAVLYLLAGGSPEKAHTVNEVAEA